MILPYSRVQNVMYTVQYLPCKCTFVWFMVYGV